MSTKDQYQNYLQSAHWADLRQRAFQKAGGCCEACRSGKNMVGHHMRYRNPLTECTPDDIMALCSRCHDTFHAWLDEEGKHLNQFDRLTTVQAIRRLIGQNKTVKHAKKKKGKPTPPPAGPKPTLISTPKVDILERVIFEQGKALLDLRIKVEALEARLAAA